MSVCLHYILHGVSITLNMRVISANKELINTLKSIGSDYNNRLQLRTINSLHYITIREPEAKH